MKHTVLALLILTTGLYTSCKKQNDDQHGVLAGKWKLTETLADPGDGSGVYTKVKGTAKYIEISSDGNITGEALPNVVKYRVLDSVQLEITDKNYQTPLVFRYKVTKKNLELNPPCIEGCGFKFVRD